VPTLLPLIGVRTRAQLDDALTVLDKTLSPADVSALEALVPASAIAGTRYAAEQMRNLDSER
jgi:aryl-alcohol dehydrogenase-like predicted oxidoreductase